MAADHYDFAIIGSGFGGSVSALRLSEKGYRVLVIEKGKEFGPGDFPKSNWDLPRWLWLPLLNFRGIFKMTFLRHITVFSGVGVGGGSLVYANTLPVPKAAFFESGSWKGMEDWQKELGPHYVTAKRMLGATVNPRMTPGDEALKAIAKDIGRSDKFEMTDVAVYFGQPGKTVPDPYFGGEGPDRTGCTYCGACMIGCRHGAKNTLDKNYLYLARKRGTRVVAQTEVEAVRPEEGGGYRLEAVTWSGWLGREKKTFTADKVVFAGGVLGTVDLLLKMKNDPEGLPKLSPRTGQLVRTNSEALIAVIAEGRDVDYSTGVAITSILHTDEHSHIEPVRYPAGSGFFRLLVSPHAPADTFIGRVTRAVAFVLKNPLKCIKALTVPDLAKFSQVLLYMRTLDGTLTFQRGRGVRTGFTKGLDSILADADPPRASIPEATDLAERFAKKIGGTPASLMTETLMGIPTTAHILGGACIGATPEDGVINGRHEVFGYPGLYVCDGSAMSANPGVNPSLTITAMTERAMSLIPRKVA